MARWATFIEEAGELGRLATERLIDRVAYLATVRVSGGPRVHPVTPLVHEGTMFVRMYPTSPKVADLRADPRFAIHSQVDDTSGTGGEILILGTAGMIDDSDWIEEALARLSDPDPERYVLLEFDLQEVKVTVYEGEETIRRRWRPAK